MPQITENIGDIFDAPPNSVLIHACNCQGSWGAGVALEFKKRYPQAYTIYNTECNTPPSPFHHRSLLGTSLLIPPQASDHAPSPRTSSADTPVHPPTGHWIACLFTSLHYGAKKSSPDVILEMTRKAMGDLAQKLKFARGRGQALGPLWCVRLNSGLFGVEWERTKRVLEQCGMDLHVVGPAEGEVVGGKRGKGKGKGKRDGKAQGGSVRGEGRAAEALAADEADPSVKRKTSKRKRQAPETDDEPTNAEAPAEPSPLPPRPEKPTRHKKQKRDAEPGAEALAASSVPTEKRRRKRGADTGPHASMQVQEGKKSRKKGKKEGGAE